jgi:hypothetical protein
MIKNIYWKTLHTIKRLCLDSCFSMLKNINIFVNRVMSADSSNQAKFVDMNIVYI